ncbi:MAG: DUF2145 domain-containing protein [Rhodocyclaceae bacterium]|nr:DUF2145 domain-containing protein [Rhodocyclaceae bacterium]
MRVAIALVAASFALAGAAEAGSRRTGASGSRQYCDRAPELAAADQDRLLRFAAVVRDELARVGEGVALISRSGLDLSRFGIRYSHAAIAWRDGSGRWAARQLYYACAEGRPRLYDQGIAGFVLGSDDPRQGQLSIVVLPPAAAEALRRTVLDKPLALRLLAARYSANAFAFGLRYQNCNQWVAELLATAWGDLGRDGAVRARAQEWLRSAGYAPRPVAVSIAQYLASVFVPLLHVDDHPEDARSALAFRISLPQAIEQFARQRYPASRRIALCHDATRVVVLRGWSDAAEGCQPRPGDRVIDLAAEVD